MAVIINQMAEKGFARSAPITGVRYDGGGYEAVDMQTLKLSQAHKSSHAQANRADNNRHLSSDDDGLIDLYPKPQYFQHIHEYSPQLQDELVQLKASVTRSLS